MEITFITINDITCQHYKHSDALRHAGIAHREKLKSSSRLAHILGQNVIGVNSLHHQVIDVLGEGLSIVAYSPEGYVACR